MGNRGQHREDVVLQSGGQQASAAITVGGLESTGIDRLARHLSGRAQPTLDATSTAIRTGRGERPGKRYGLASANGGLRDKARGLGVNEFARPEVGEGFAVFSVFAQKNDEKRAWDYTTGARRNKKGHIWGYHHAAVVARSLDGNDWMTLENYARSEQIQDKAYEYLVQKYSGVARDKVNALKRAGTPEKEIRAELHYYLLYEHDRARSDFQSLQSNLATPTLWFFRMYGSRPGQSFHEEQAASGAFVNPLTVRIRKDAVVQLDKTEEVILDSIDANRISWSSARAPLNTLATETTQAFIPMRADLAQLRDAQTGNQRTAGLRQVNDDYTTWLDDTFVPRMAAALSAIKRGTVGAADTLEDLKAEVDNPETLGLLSRVGYGIYDFFNDFFSSDNSRARLTSLANLRTAINDVPEKVV